MYSAYKHLIITRFNLRNKNWDDYTKNASKILTEDWLKERFILFTNFCFPSVINQTNKNFEWWVYFDTNTPLKFKNQIDKLKKESELFIPFYIHEMGEFLPHIQNRIKNIDSDYIITSRLDNDDALHENYVAFIQNQFLFQGDVAFDILSGYTLQIEPVVYFGLKEHMYNPFISYVEKNVNAQSVWKQSHTSWKKAKNVVRFKERLWMSIIHDSNKVNEYTGYAKPKMEILNQFHFSENKIQELSKNRKYSAIQAFKNAIKTKLELIYKDLKKRIGIYK